MCTSCEASTSGSWKAISLDNDNSAFVALSKGSKVGIGNVYLATFEYFRPGFMRFDRPIRIKHLPGDFRSWESPQTLPALFIGPFGHAERFRNLKFAVNRITNIQSTVLSSYKGTAAIHLAFK